MNNLLLLTEMNNITKQQRLYCIAKNNTKNSQLSNFVFNAHFIMRRNILIFPCNLKNPPVWKIYFLLIGVKTYWVCHLNKV